ncbi:MAG TPA: TolC family protein [Bryobacteraceae bacterium]|nr:TolC family protein [Bryobacteraceae bacterium]
MPIYSQSAVRVEAPKGGLGWLTRPYQARIVPPVSMANSSRLDSLVSAGNLYLSAQDVVDLVIENNIDLEIQRYGPVMTNEVLLRAKGGGLLRSVGISGVISGPTSVSLTGVNVNASGGASTGAAGTGVSASGGVITTLGPTIPSLDPQLSFVGQWSHTTTPESNTIITGTTALIQTAKFYQAQYAQTFPFGMTTQFTFSSDRLQFNSFDFNVDPYTSGDLDLQITQNLLYGFGSAVNGRNIKVARNNVKVSDLQFKQQVITTVTAVLNLYWDLVSFNQDLQARKDELATAQALFEDNKKQVQIGTLAPIEVTRAEAQVYSAQQDLLISQTNLLQQETVLKNSLSRNGVASPTLAEVHVIPLDTITVPQKDELKPLDELVQEALTNRVEIQQAELNLESNRMLLVGIKNELKPKLQAFVELTNNGLSGIANPDSLIGPAPQFLVGGYGNLLGQIFRRNFPNYTAALSFSIPLRNRQAQSDYASSALEIRQDELNLQKQRNQIRVDVQNAVIGLQQARVRYDSAVKARILQQQTLDADKKKYTLGASTVFQVVQDQRDLATAETTEVEALANYSHARIALDQAVGTTLELNHISLPEALAGKVSRRSALPEHLPAGNPATAQPAVPQP